MHTYIYNSTYICTSILGNLRHLFRYSISYHYDQRESVYIKAPAEAQASDLAAVRRIHEEAKQTDQRTDP